MAIPAVNATLQANAPTKTGQIVVSGGKSSQAQVYAGTAQATLDGVATTFVVNFIDGTQALPFIPSAVIATRTSPASDTAAATISVSSASSITNTGFTVTISAAGTNTQLLTVAFIALQ